MNRGCDFCNRTDNFNTHFRTCGYKSNIVKAIIKVRLCDDCYDKNIKSIAYDAGVIVNARA